MLFPLLIVAGTFTCLIAACVLLAIELALALTWREPTLKSDEAPVGTGRLV